jgi:hypothetical protein
MPKKSTAKTITKADFIRSCPKNMPAKDVVAKAKAAGISLKEEAVYKTRSLDKARKGSKKSSARAAGRKTTAVKASRGSSGDAIIAFYRAVKSVGGVGRAKELLANIEAFENA